ncbi:hypothetical protein [Deinococcus sp. QL22]|uniref:hypothetical protein n=1 Tax=Deinococcus sp. QL22 TaxID=2939437 RepID=UPI002016AE21|nr:hypothetical protein [Deinococcus sp. QL22]UQN08767.1 hypothetical protein M1R55_21875 [Deinococcus sp. QL22]
MTRRKTLGPAEAAAVLFAAGWDVQPNGRVLCPVRGVTPLLSVDQIKLLLPLGTETRSIIEVGRWFRIERPPSVRVNGVTLVSFERADLRDAEVVERAALVQSVGASRGVVTGQSDDDYRDHVAVRVDGMTIIEERERVWGPSVVRLQEDPKPRKGVNAGTLVGFAAMLCAVTLR